MRNSGGKSFITIFLALGILLGIAYYNFGLPIDNKGFSSVKLYKWRYDIAKLDRQEQLDLIKREVEVVTNNDLKEFNPEIIKPDDKTKKSLFYFELPISDGTNITNHVFLRPRKTNYDKKYKDKDGNEKTLKDMLEYTDTPIEPSKAFKYDDSLTDSIKESFKKHIDSGMKFKKGNKILFPIPSGVDYKWYTRSNKPYYIDKIVVGGDEVKSDDWKKVYVMPDKGLYNIDFMFGRYYFSFNNAKNWWCYSSNLKGKSTNDKFVPSGDQKLDYGDVVGIATKKTRIYIYVYDSEKKEFKKHKTFSSLLE